MVLHSFANYVIVHVIFKIRENYVSVQKISSAEFFVNITGRAVPGSAVEGNSGFGP